nr:DUF397 domain-containing protein [Actinoplanes friuliensis]
MDREVRWISRCADGACVEVALDGEDVLVRDSKRTDGPSLKFSRSEWAAFQDGILAGDFD